MASSATETDPQAFVSRSSIAFAVTLLAGGIAIGFFFGRRSAALPRAASRCNTRVHLEKDKVVDNVELEDIGEKKVFCRCWKSSKFPYCDGTHTLHNKQTGDNVGPLIVKGKKAS